MLVRHGEVLGFFVAIRRRSMRCICSRSASPPSAQGLGHGRCLLHALHEWARQVAAHTLLAGSARSSNARARSLYEGAGFSAVGQRERLLPRRPRRARSRRADVQRPVQRPGRRHTISLALDARRLAMLEAMGITLWVPEAVAQSRCCRLSL